MTDLAHAAPSCPIAAADITHWDMETDVVVVGFGAAGASTAIEAARGGAKVMLFEAASASGGTSALSGGEMYLGGSGGTPIQNAAGFHDETEDLYQYLMATGGPNPDAAKVRLYAEGSLDHFQWLLAQGIEYKNSYIAERCIEPSTDDCLIWSGSEEAWPFVSSAKPAPRGHSPKYLGMGGGKYVMEQLAKQAVAAGTEVHYNARAVALIADHHQHVKGLAVKIDGKVLAVRAHRGVVLCAGGFIMNREMVKRHAPLMLRSQYPIGSIDDGSGIRLGMSVGGATINMHEGFVTIPWYPPGSLVKGIFINNQGQRFINEDCYHGRVSHHAIQQAGDHIWLLQDHATYAVSEMHTLARMEIGAAGDSWDEIERELGLPHNSLVSTVSVYNEYAAKGTDPLFHKAAKWLKPLNEPPFVAIDCRIDHAFYASFTLGGLDTLPSGEVRNEDGQIIPGLFAAGRTACGLPRSGAGYSSGLSLADASFFGRQAGITLANTRL